MQRITRLLTGASPGSRWRLPAGILVLLASGGLLATQLDISRRALPGIRIESSTSGPLGPGDEREITVTGLDGERYYRASVDADGTVVALAPRWTPPDPESPDAWDTYPPQVTGPLLERAAACEVRRGVCAECLLRLRREGVTR